MEIGRTTLQAHPPQLPVRTAQYSSQTAQVGFLADAVNYIWDNTNKRLGLGTATPTTGTIADFNGTGASGSSILLPRDTAANRPTVGVNGMIRYNSVSNAVETYANGTWASLATGLATSNYLQLVGGTMTGAIANASGTAALPSLTFSVDQTTGVYTTGAGNLSLSTAGVQRIAISNSGLSRRGHLSRDSWYNR